MDYIHLTVCQLVNSSLETTRVFWRTKMGLPQDLIHSSEDIKLIFPEPTEEPVKVRRGPMLIFYPDEHGNEVSTTITVEEIKHLARTSSDPGQNYSLGYSKDDLILQHNTMWKN